jgi:FAD/FMN-containing dehydrogenase
MIRVVAFGASLLLLAAGHAAAADCPSFTPLALSCGDGVCNPLLGESSQTCPGDCLDPATHVKPFYGLAAECPETIVFRPRTVAEAATAMRLSVAQGRHVRVVGTVHTGSGAVCSQGGNVISTELLDRIAGLEDYHGQRVVNVQAGALIWDVLGYLHEHGKALGYNVPGYGDITVAGFLAVGGHGTDAHGSATMSSLVVAIDKMDPFGQARTYDAANTSEELWRALRADLGLLGMTVGVRLRVREQFHVRQQLLSYDADELFRPGGMQAIAERCGYIFATYLSSVGRLDVTCGNETSDPVTAPDARMTLFTPSFPKIFQDLAVVTFQAAACDPEVARKNEKLVADFREANPWLEWTDAGGQPQRGREAVGYAHRMTEITFRGLPQAKFSNRDWEVALPESEIDEALQYVKATLEAERLYNPAIGVVIRADRSSTDSLLASSAADSQVPAGERLYYIEFPIFWPYGFTPERHAAYEEPYARMTRTLIERHRARPHWGKNRGDIFSDPVTLASGAERRALFQPFIDEFDPFGVFANDFLRDAGFTWPQDGQDWVPDFFPEWAGARFTLRNAQDGRCLQDTGGTRLEVQPCKGTPEQSFYLFLDGRVLDAPEGPMHAPDPAPVPGESYALRPASRFQRCAAKGSGSAVHLDACADVPLAAQLWTLAPKSTDTVQVRALDGGVAPCLKATEGLSAVWSAGCGELLTDPAEQRRRSWRLLAE